MSKTEHLHKAKREVPGTDGKYLIDITSTEARCYSVKRGKYLANTPDKRDGRIFWTLTQNNKRQHYQAARWVAMTYPEFVQNEWFEGAEIDHIDTDRTNNHPSNLRWTDRKGNCNNPITLKHYSDAHRGRTLTEETKSKLSTTHKGKHHTEESKMKISLAHKGKTLSEEHKKNVALALSKEIIQMSIDNTILKCYVSSGQASKETGIERSSINRCCNGKLKTAGGYKWSFKNKEIENMESTSSTD